MEVTTDVDREDIHVCRPCGAEFLTLTDMMEHKCPASGKPVAYFSPDHQSKVDEGRSNGAPSPNLQRHSPDERYLSATDADLERISQNAIIQLQNMANGTGQHAAGTDRTAVRDVHKEEGVAEGIEDGMEEEDEDDYEEGDYEEGEYDDDMGETDEGVPVDNNTAPGPFTFAVPVVGTNVVHNSNVKLESLQNTKVAVAQFAENNIPPTDIASLQTTLYSLQQQQLFQLQLLQNIQQQIMTAGLQSLPPATIQALTAGMLPGFPNMAVLAQLQGMMPKMAQFGRPATAGPTGNIPSATPSGKGPSSPPEVASTLSSSTSSVATATSAVTTTPVSLTSSRQAPSPRVPPSLVSHVSSSSGDVSVVTKAMSSSQSTVAPSSHGLPAIPPLSSIGAPIFSTVVPEMSQISLLQSG
ncbi:hypothetical protein LSH36_65g01041 [Paralvinella palmiformis]|uniref:Uncharacterized protein n=1 Tax=Paralvinella palmiformis TaxID=53620 RepID=A0AAD9K573_9ANNE|nr:hypothetical protein LSH36_65g01041 [Paralvinella palmiformis]